MKSSLCFWYKWLCSLTRFPQYSKAILNDKRFRAPFLYYYVWSVFEKKKPNIPVLLTSYYFCNSECFCSCGWCAHQNDPPRVNITLCAYYVPHIWNHLTINLCMSHKSSTLTVLRSTNLIGLTYRTLQLPNNIPDLPFSLVLLLVHCAIRHFLTFSRYRWHKHRSDRTTASIFLRIIPSWRNISIDSSILIVAVSLLSQCFRNWRELINDVSSF